MTIFGQNPADVSGALFKAANLGDVPNIATARANLQVPSITDVQYNSVPIGMILPYWGSVAPAGYLPCSGQTITSTTFPDLVTFLGGTGTATVPDLRGEFLRGWDNGRGIDTGRSNSTWQSEAIKQTPLSSALNILTGGTGTSANISTGGGQYISNSASSFWIGSGSETRPRNVSVLYCIKAYSSVANYTSSFNVAGLISDFSTLNSAAVKYADFAGSNQSKVLNGYQKLPGGLIMQWGTSTIPAANTAITFPITFPTAGLSFLTGTYNNTVYADTVEILSSIGVSGITVVCVSSGASGASAITAGSFNWMVLGY